MIHVALTISSIAPFIIFTNDLIAERTRLSTLLQMEMLIQEKY